MITNIKSYNPDSLSFPLHTPKNKINKNAAKPLEAAFRPGNILLITILSNFQATAKTAILFIQPQYNVTTLSPGMQCTEESLNTHLNSQSMTYIQCLRFRFTPAAAVPAHCIIILLSFELWLRMLPDVNHTFWLQTFAVCLFSLLLCMLRGRGDILPLRMEGLRHHRLLFLHRHHPPRSGAGVSSGCKYPVSVA